MAGDVPSYPPSSRLPPDERKLVVVPQIAACLENHHSAKNAARFCFGMSWAETGSLG
jgi:hypothetical protein